MVTSIRSRVRMRVERRPISSTVPVTPAAVTVSPTLNGLSPAMVTAPKMFSIVFWEANAIAMPPMPRPASIARTLMPITSIAPRRMRSERKNLPVVEMIGM